MIIAHLVGVIGLFNNAMQDGRRDVLPKKEQQGQKVNSSLRFSNALVYFVYHLLVNAVGALMTHIDFTLSNARRFYSSMGNPSAVN